MSRLFLTVLVLGLIATPAAANAAPIAESYCELSLRGGGSLAPDNDVRAKWDEIEEYYGYNLVKSWPAEWHRFWHSPPEGTADNPLGANDLHVGWAFERANGMIEYREARCWRYPYYSTGTYHDGFLTAR